MNVTHPGTAEATAKDIKEVNAVDDYGNAYLAASQLIKVSLAYNGNSTFTISILNNSGGTSNETPVPNPNNFTTLPDINRIIKVTFQ